MRIQVVPEFEKALKKLSKKYPSLRSDFLHFLADLDEDPYIGAELFPNCRKVRMAIKSKGRGKSAGARIIIYIQGDRDQITLLYIYDKSEIDNLATDFIEYLIRLWVE